VAVVSEVDEFNPFTSRMGHAAKATFQMTHVGVTSSRRRGSRGIHTRRLLEGRRRVGGWWAATERSSS